MEGQGKLGKGAGVRVVCAFAGAYESAPLEFHPLPFLCILHKPHFLFPHLVVLEALPVWEFSGPKERHEGNSVGKGGPEKKKKKHEDWHAHIPTWLELLSLLVVDLTQIWI